MLQGMYPTMLVVLVSLTKSTLERTVGLDSLPTPRIVSPVSVWREAARSDQGLEERKASDSQRYAPGAVLVIERTDELGHHDRYQVCSPIVQVVRDRSRRTKA